MYPTNLAVQIVAVLSDS